LEISYDYALVKLIEVQPILGYHANRGQTPFHLSRATKKILTSGNRFGKSSGAVADTSMIIQGVHPNQDMFRKSTEKMPFKWRYISEPQVLKGIVQETIDSLFPKGTITKGPKDQTGFYTTYYIHGFNPSGEEYWAEIEFKNNGSPVATFAGTWFDKITIDEVCPEIVFIENRARIGATGYPLYMDIVWTAEDSASWAETTIFENPEFHNPAIWFHYEGSTWDNCRCLTPETHGLHCRCNGGWLPKSEIKELEDFIRRSDPLRHEMKILGKRGGSSRSVFPILSRDVHIIDSLTGKNRYLEMDWENGRPRYCTLYFGIDPHGTRPDFVECWAKERLGRMICIDEFPNFVDGIFAGQLYEKIRQNATNQTTYDQLAGVLIDMSKRYGWPNKVNVGGIAIDPHWGVDKFKDSTGQVRQVVQWLNDAIRKRNEVAKPPYNKFPSVIISPVTKENGKEKDAGHRQIREELHYDALRDIGKGNMPNMYFTTRVVNTYRAIAGFKTKKPSSIDGASIINSQYEEELEHGVAVCRYTLAMKPEYTAITPVNVDSIWGDKPASPAFATETTPLNWGGISG
jgi:hypothetical protein